MPDYQKGKIYQIVAPNGSKYIGSTTQEIHKRLNAHKTRYRSWKDGKYKYMITCFKLFEEFGVENCKLELLELYPCNSKKELDTREGVIIKSIECVNKVVPGQDELVWREENREDLRSYWKTYYINNIDKYIERNKLHYQNNKEYNRERCKNYREKNKEKISEQRRLKHSQNNIETQ
jgi:hypothetical protein